MTPPSATEGEIAPQRVLNGVHGHGIALHLGVNGAVSQKLLGTVTRHSAYFVDEIGVRGECCRMRQQAVFVFRGAD